VIREEIPADKLDIFFEVLQKINRLLEDNEIYKKIGTKK